MHLHGFEPTETADAIVRELYSRPTFTPWLEYTKVHDIPVLPEDRPR